MTFSILFMALIFATMPLAAADYDLVIVNGRVMDPESGLDAVRNVGVRDGKIAAITRDAIKGKETINARNHVVAPGFIDGHSHIVKDSKVLKDISSGKPVRLTVQE